jgi:hypothetical protein
MKERGIFLVLQIFLRISIHFQARGESSGIFLVLQIFLRISIHFQARGESYISF